MRRIAPSHPIIAETESRPRRNDAGDRLVTVARLFESERSRRAVPMIRLRGQWLQQLGFTAGKRIAITAEANRLVITLEEAR
jgi:type I toxin-antitoxin system toxin SymE